MLQNAWNIIIIAMVAIFFLTAVGCLIADGIMARRKEKRRQHEVDKQFALDKARRILAELRSGGRMFSDGAECQIETIIDPNLITPEEAGTTREEVKQLLQQSAARWQVERALERMRSAVSEGEFNGLDFILRRSLLVACENLSGLGLSDQCIRTWRQNCRIRHAQLIAREMADALVSAQHKINLLRELLVAAQCGLGELELSPEQIGLIKLLMPDQAQASASAKPEQPEPPAGA